MLIINNDHSLLVNKTTSNTSVYIRYVHVRPSVHNRVLSIPTRVLSTLYSNVVIDIDNYLDTYHLSP